MIVSDPGHDYNVLFFDPEGRMPAIIPRRGSSITFFKKIGEKFPENEGYEHWGTNCQEVIRVLINRANWLNGQQFCIETTNILTYLRLALYWFEYRAARVKGKDSEFKTLSLEADFSAIEDVPFCNICGHIYPHSHVGEKK
jgi:hypothetical protein